MGRHNVLIVGPNASDQARLLDFLGHAMEDRTLLKFYEISKGSRVAPIPLISDEAVLRTMDGLPEQACVETGLGLASPTEVGNKIDMVWFVWSAKDLCKTKTWCCR
jgi:hypothetical protein